MKRLWKLSALSLAVTLGIGVGFLGPRAWAGVPSTGALTYSGTLESASGTPQTGSFNLQVNFWAAATGGTTPLCQVTKSGYQLDAGRFSITLDDTCTNAVKASPDVWAELLVDANSLGRTKLGAVPYAVEAGHAVAADNATKATNATTAASLGTLAPADVQQVVTGTCAAGSSIRSIAANGTVTCEPDDNTTYAAGTGISLTTGTFSVNTTTIQQRVTGTCTAGSSIRAIAANGTVTCDAPSVVQYTVTTVSAPAPGQPATVTTAKHSFCGLSHVHVFTNDYTNGNYRNCDLTRNGDGTWTLGALGTADYVECNAYCF